MLIFKTLNVLLISLYFQFLSLKMKNTSQQYEEVILQCRELFIKKMKDYGSAWRILRTSSITDQIFIKAQRIRSIEDKGTQRIEEGVQSEFVGILNYSIIALIQLALANDSRTEIPSEEAGMLFDKFANQCKKLMEDKNHDYGEAWRDMRVSSITDLILMKIFRVKQIEDNNGQLLVSEGIDANYMDMVNYAAFALILMNEKNKV
jgi:hypothetical protein